MGRPTRSTSDSAWPRRETRRRDRARSYRAAGCRCAGSARPRRSPRRRGRCRATCLGTIAPWALLRRSVLFRQQGLRPRALLEQLDQRALIAVEPFALARQLEAGEPFLLA